MIGFFRKINAGLENAGIQERNRFDENEVPELNETGEEDHGDQHHDGGIDELLIFTKAFDFRIGLPWPAGLAEFTLHFTEEGGDFREHGLV